MFEFDDATELDNEDGPESSEASNIKSTMKTAQDFISELQSCVSDLGEKLWNHSKRDSINFLNLTRLLCSERIPLTFLPLTLLFEAVEQQGCAMNNQRMNEISENSALFHAYGYRLYIIS